MTKAEIEAIRERQVPVTGRTVAAMCDALLAVLEVTARPSPAQSEGQGTQFLFGYKTIQRVIAATIDETPLP